MWKNPQASWERAAKDDKMIDIKNRYGEEMSDSLRDSIEDRLTNTMRMISMDMFSKRIGIVSK